MAIFEQTCKSLTLAKDLEEVRRKGNYSSRTQSAMRYRVLILLLCPVLMLILMSSNVFASRGTTTACRSNLKNMETALEMYSSDNHKDYPPSLSSLTPKYLKTLPLCPISQWDYYYEVDRSHRDYTVLCRGWTHRKIVGNTNLAVTSGSGLTEIHIPSPTDNENLIIIKRIRDDQIAQIRYNLKHGDYQTEILLVIIGVLTLIILIVHELNRRKADRV